MSTDRRRRTGGRQTHDQRRELTENSLHAHSCGSRGRASFTQGNYRELHLVFSIAIVTATATATDTATALAIPSICGRFEWRGKGRGAHWAGANQIL